MKFSATIEFVTSHRAIVALTDSRGEWAGAHRIEIRLGSKADLYEAGYAAAEREAAIKGGTLDRFSVAA